MVATPGTTKASSSRKRKGKKAMQDDEVDPDFPPEELDEDEVLNSEDEVKTTWCHRKVFVTNYFNIGRRRR